MKLRRGEGNGPPSRLILEASRLQRGSPQTGCQHPIHPQSSEETARMTTIGVEKATELGPKDFERLVLRALASMKKGDFSVRMPVEFTGVQGKIADTLNDILDLNERTAFEIERISTVVGKEGKLSARAQVPAAEIGRASCRERV